MRKCSQEAEFAALALLILILNKNLTKFFLAFLFLRPLGGETKVSFLFENSIRDDDMHRLRPIQMKKGE